MDHLTGIAATGFPNDYAMATAIFGVFGFSWFGWAQESPPPSWRLALGLAAALCLSLAGVGGYLAFTNWGAASALTATGAYQTFGLVVGIEVAAALLGAGVLRYWHQQAFTAPWVAFVVGLHMLPLASVFQDRALYGLGFLLMAAAVAPLVLAHKLRLSASTMTGVGAASALLAYATRGLFLAVNGM